MDVVNSVHLVIQVCEITGSGRMWGEEVNEEASGPKNLRYA